MRDYYVVGLPLFLGLAVSFPIPGFTDLLPPLLTPLAGNGLVVGMVSLMLLEHVLLRQPD